MERVGGERESKKGRKGDGERKRKETEKRGWGGREGKLEGGDRRER